MWVLPGKEGMHSIVVTFCKYLEGGNMSKKNASNRPLKTWNVITVSACEWRSNENIKYPRSSVIGRTCSCLVHRINEDCLEVWKGDKICSLEPASTASIVQCGIPMDVLLSPSKTSPASVWNSSWCESRKQNTFIADVLLAWCLGPVSTSKSLI